MIKMWMFLATRLEHTLRILAGPSFPEEVNVYI